MTTPARPTPRPGRRAVLWLVGVVLALFVAFSAYLALPIVLGGGAGQSGLGDVEGYPTTVSATGDDGRERTLSVRSDDATLQDLAAVNPGDRLVVTGTGYDEGSGIYVAICKIPDSPEQRPGPCLGGVPELDEEREATPGVVEYAASNWINDDWAWRLFGARSFEGNGSFTAYILVPPAADENVDCTVESCALYTRNDHTDLDNRMQDLYLPVAFGE